MANKVAFCCPQRNRAWHADRLGRPASDRPELLAKLAESEGFEPPIPLRVLLISNQVPSAARPALPISAPICSGQRRDVKQVWRRGWDSNPRYVAVYTLSKRAPSAARPPLRSLPAPGAEERAEQLPAFRRQHPARHFHAVVEARIAWDVEEGPRRARLGIGHRVDQPVDARID